MWGMLSSCLTLATWWTSPPGSSAFEISCKNTEACHFLFLPGDPPILRDQSWDSVFPALAGWFFYHWVHLEAASTRTCESGSGFLAPHGLGSLRFPPSMGFSKNFAEYWRLGSFLSRDLPNSRDLIPAASDGNNLSWSVQPRWSPWFVCDRRWAQLGLSIRGSLLSPSG